MPRSVLALSLLLALPMLGVCGAARADIVFDDVRRPQRPPHPTSIAVDLGPYRASGYGLVTVAEGDTLYELARTHLGAGGRWPEIALLGDVDADRLKIGAKLVLPPKHPPAADASPGRWDFFLLAGTDPMTVRPFLPDAPIDVRDGVPVSTLLAVRHAHLQRFLESVRGAEDVGKAVDALVAAGVVARSDALAVPPPREGAPARSPVLELRVETIAEGRIAIEGLGDAGEVPEGDDAEERDTSVPAPLLEDAPEGGAAASPAPGQADPLVLAGVLLAIVAAAFLTLRRMGRAKVVDTAP